MQPRPLPGFPKIMHKIGSLWPSFLWRLFSHAEHFGNKWGIILKLRILSIKCNTWFSCRAFRLRMGEGANKGITSGRRVLLVTWSLFSHAERYSNPLAVISSRRAMCTHSYNLIFNTVNGIFTIQNLSLNKSDFSEFFQRAHVQSCGPLWVHIRFHLKAGTKAFPLVPLNLWYSYSTLRNRENANCCVYFDTPCRVIFSAMFLIQRLTGREMSWNRHQ